MESYSDNNPRPGWAVRMARAVAAAAEQGRLLRLLATVMRKITVCLTIVWLIGLLGLFLVLRFVGERNIATAVLLYLPQAVWLLPLLLLVPLSLLFHRRCLLASLGGLVLAARMLMGYQWHPGSAASTTQGQQILSVMTNNRGQSMNQSLQPFKNSMRPDLLLLQDAKARAPGYLASVDYKEFTHGGSMGEHTLLSRFPILESVLLDPAADGNGMRHARFVIGWQGQKVSVYSVHQMTPRHVLATYRRGAFLFGVLGLPGTPWAEKRRSYQDFWDRQIADARHLLKIVQADQNPTLVVGDFNAPHCGYVHRLLASVLKDAHIEAGNGLGYTFPGTTASIISLGGPWLRIDYIFHNHQWRTLECVTEPDRPSQHRAVFARMALAN